MDWAIIYSGVEKTKCTGRSSHICLQKWSYKIIVERGILMIINGEYTLEEQERKRIPTFYDVLQKELNKHKVRDY